MVPDQNWLRALLEQLERIDRPSASEGERLAADDLAENVDFATVADGVRLSDAAIRRLGDRWL